MKNTMKTTLRTVDEVRRTYSQISFDHALDVQRRVETDDWLRSEDAT